MILAIALGVVALVCLFIGWLGRRQWESATDVQLKNLEDRVTEAESHFTWTPPSTDQVANTVLQYLDKECRCPHCQAVVRRKQKFCGACGVTFCQAPLRARLVDTCNEHRQLAPAVKGQPPREEVRPLLSWECMVCGKVDHIKFNPWKTRRQTIVVLHCDECDENVGDALIDTGVWIDNRDGKWVLRVAPHGEIRLDSHETPKPAPVQEKTEKVAEGSCNPG